MALWVPHPALLGAARCCILGTMATSISCTPAMYTCVAIQRVQM